MTYDEWADEYLKSARATKEKIVEYEEKKRKCRSPTLLFEYTRKLDILYGMYSDCMYTADKLRRKADSLRKRGLDKIIMV